MKIGIYAKWLNSLGGGEKVASVMAEVLSERGHEVDLISTFNVEKKDIEQKMGVNLEKVKLVAWFERSYNNLTPKTKRYDLFINTSYLDHLPSMAKKSLYYVHFPSPIKRTFLGFVKYETLLPFLRSFLVIPSIDRGLKHLDDVNERGGKWLGRRNTIVLSNSPKDFVVSMKVYFESIQLSQLERIRFSSPNSKLKVTDSNINYKTNVMSFVLSVTSSSNESVIIRLNVKGDLVCEPVALVSLTVKNLRFTAWNLIKKFLPEYEMALYGSSSYRPAAGLETYSKFLTNSLFTQYWTKKYWAKDSEILYPPVDVEEFKTGKKENIILNVGRFFVGGHSKRQDVLVDVFTKMVSQKLIDKSWKLILIGGISDGWEHAEYFRKIKESIKGYPIEVLPSASFQKLKEVYSKAKIYWHATGYGQSQKINPIRFEHFGITPVEAMAAECVSVVYRGGGLVETVNHNEIGYTWKTKDELVEYTRKIVRDKKLMSRMSKKSVKRAQLFSRKVFSKRLLEIVEEMI